MKSHTLELNKWIGSLGGNATVVVAVSGDSDVSRFTPALSPRVLDEPIVSVLGISAVSDKEDSMVELFRRAFFLVVDSGSVELEASVTSIDGDRDRSLSGDSNLELFFISFRKIDESSVVSPNALLSEMALLLGSFIRIRIFSVDSVILLDVLEGKVHQSTVASIVTVLGRAINDVLFGKGSESTGSSLVLSFEGSSSGESVATSAHSRRYCIKRYNYTEILTLGS